MRIFSGVYGHRPLWVFHSTGFFFLGLAIWAGAAGSVAARSSYAGHADASNAAIVARNLVRGQGYSVGYVWHFVRKQSIPRSEDERPLLFPTLLAASMATLGDHPLAWRLPNILLVVGTVLVLRALSLKVYGRPTVANLTALAYLLLGQYQPIQLLNNTLNTFLATSLLFVAALASFQDSWGYRVGVGVLGGLALLARPENILLVGLVAICLAWWGARRGTSATESHDPIRPLWATFLRTAFPVLLIALAVWSPWLVRNQVLFGHVLHFDRSLAIPFRYDWFGPQSPAPAAVMAPDEGYALRYDRPFTVREIIGRAGGVYPWIRVETLVVLGHLQAIMRSVLGLLGVLACVLACTKSHWGDLERRLLGICGLAFFGFVSFMITRLHHEERYYFPYIPIALAFVVGRLHALIVSVPSARLRRGCSAMAVLFLSLLSAQNVRDSVAMLRHGGEGVPSDVQWVATNVPPGSRVMTRDPWETHFHTEREAVMIPYGTAADILSVMKEYDVEFLVVRKASRRPGLVETLHREMANGLLKKVFEQDDFVAFRRYQSRNVL